MADFKVTTQFKPTVKATRRAIALAMDRVASEIQRELKQKTGRQGPPPSKPGQYPKKDTGLLNESIEVKRRGRQIIVTTVDYGRFVENKAPTRGGRPFISRVVTKKKREWGKKITKYAKQAKPTRRSR